MRRCLSTGLALLSLLLFLSGNKPLSGNKLLVNNKPEEKSRNERVRTIVERFRTNLSIPEEVFVSIVPQNQRLVSVERSKDRHKAFILSLDQNFLDTLGDSELTAAIAHELGHVWIFTHHPYLQTELLANQIAMKVVTRESLEKVYDRVWKDKGTKGDLKGFLGQELVARPLIRQNQKSAEIQAGQNVDWASSGKSTLEEITPGNN